MKVKKRRTIYAVVLFMLISALLLAACGPYKDVTTYDYLKEKGFDAEKEHQLVGVEKLTGQIGEIEGRFRSAFFFGGSGSITGSTRPGSVLGFAVQSQNTSEVVILEYSFQLINFVMNDSIAIPTVKLNLKNEVLWRQGVDDNSSIWGPKEDGSYTWQRYQAVDYFTNHSTAAILGEKASHVTITISPEHFRREVMPLQFR